MRASALQLSKQRPPIPPADLILRISNTFDAQNIDGSRSAFDLVGLEHLRCFERALWGQGRSFEDFARLLDFGCGCGRFLRHMGSLAHHVEIHGTDIDAEMIAWLRGNVPFGRFEVAPHEPPLPYPDHHFDLVINHSVFTHLDERLQDLWLVELQRITQEGALLLLTVQSQASWNRMCEASDRAGDETERWRAQLESRGILFISDDAFIGSTHPDFYHSTVHAPWYVFEHWTRFFDITAYLPEGSWSQDLVVMRRRGDGAPKPRPIGHRADVTAQQGAEDKPASTGRPLGASLSTIRRLARKRRRDHVPGAASAQLNPQAVERQLNMLRAGLYEQGNRISVIAAELRAEIASLLERDKTADPSRERDETA
jgi:SAM-dependent methyltransferase